jgi:hypothetical protein
MTEETFQQLILSHHHFPSAILNLMQGFDVDVLRERESPDRWSPLEILAHLRDEEIEDFRKRAHAALEGEPLELNLDPQGWVTARRYNEMDPGAVYLDFARERAASCQWLETLRVEDFSKAVEHPKIGTLRAGDFIAAWRMHDLVHMRQFATALAVGAGRRMKGWKMEYAGTLPFTP